MIPTSHGETFNILRYEVLQKYDTHYDVFDPFEYGNIQNERESMLKYYGTSSIDDCDELILDSYLASEANENEYITSSRKMQPYLYMHVYLGFIPEWPAYSFSFQTYCSWTRKSSLSCFPQKSHSHRVYELGEERRGRTRCRAPAPHPYVREVQCIFKHALASHRLEAKPASCIEPSPHCSYFQHLPDSSSTFKAGDEEAVEADCHYYIYNMPSIMRI
ncbi:hypothetical protein HN873_010853 [Arachis hypogaea]